MALGGEAVCCEQGTPVTSCSQTGRGHGQNTVLELARVRQNGEPSSINSVTSDPARCCAPPPAFLAKIWFSMFWDGATSFMIPFHCVSGGGLGELPVR